MIGLREALGCPWIGFRSGKTPNLLRSPQFGEERDRLLAYHLLFCARIVLSENASAVSDALRQRIGAVS